MKFTQNNEPTTNYYRYNELPLTFTPRSASTATSKQETMPANNFFFSAPDPLLGTSPNFNDIDSQLQDLQRMQDELAKKQQMLQQSRQQLQQPPQSPPKSQTPVWDEIDSLMQSMPDAEFARVSSNDEYIESERRITALLQSMQVRLLRPHIEASKEGKEALDYHLTLVRRLKNAASKEMDDELAEMREYKEKYADMPFAEYQKMKRDKKGAKK